MQRTTSFHLRVGHEFTNIRSDMTPRVAAEKSSRLRQHFIASGRRQGLPFRVWIRTNQIRVWRGGYCEDKEGPQQQRYFLATTRSDAESHHQEWAAKQGFAATKFEQVDKDLFRFSGTAAGQPYSFKAQGAEAALREWSRHCGESGELDPVGIETIEPLPEGEPPAPDDQPERGAQG